MKTLNYVQLKIKCIFHRGMRIYFISRKTSNLKHTDVEKKRVHIYIYIGVVLRKNLTILIEKRRVDLILKVRF